MRDEGMKGMVLYLIAANVSSNGRSPFRETASVALQRKGFWDARLRTALDVHEVKMNQVVSRDRRIEYQFAGTPQYPGLGWKVNPGNGYYVPDPETRKGRKLLKKARKVGPLESLSHKVLREEYDLPSVVESEERGMQQLDIYTNMDRESFVVCVPEELACKLDSPGRQEFFRMARPISHTDWFGRYKLTHKYVVC